MARKTTEDTTAADITEEVTEEQATEEQAEEEALIEPTTEITEEPANGSLIGLAGHAATLEAWENSPEGKAFIQQAKSDEG